MSIGHALKKALFGAGFEVVRLDSLRRPLERRRRLLKRLDIDLVLDVGANEGQYASRLRGIGYGGEILSFEPLARPFAVLARRASKDPHWHAINCAVGPSPGTATLNVAGNAGKSSSFHAMLDEHVAAAPRSAYVGTEEVPVRRLDEAAAGAMKKAGRTFLKADVQGYELEVLDSASAVLSRVIGLQLELSLVPVYAGGPEFAEVLERVRELGFDLVGLEPGFASKDGRLFQADALFERRNLEMWVPSGAGL